mgnify:CR=1 FL=1
MPKIYQIIAVSVLSSVLCACVTQNYENNEENPVIEQSSSDDEIALTRISLAMGYLNMGNTTQAKLNLEKAKRFAPHLTKVYTAFAHYYDTVEEPEQAITAFEKALSLDADDADTLNNYGVFLCKQAAYDESEKYMLKAIAVPSYLQVSQSYENLALCQLENKRFDKAELYLAKSIAHSPANSSALFQMLRLQYAMGKYDEALLYLKRYEKSTRRFTPNALALAFKAYQKINNQKIAKNYAAMLVKMFPNSYESQQYILNGLQQVEADTLASQFVNLNKSKNNEPKKRVMVLSPNKKTGISLKAKPQSKNKLLENEKNTANQSLVNNTDNKDTVTDTKSTIKNKTTQTIGKALLTESLKPTSSVKTVEKNLDRKRDNSIASSLVGKVDSKVASNAKNKVEVLTSDNKNTQKEQYSSAKSLSKNSNSLAIPTHIIAKGEGLFTISKKYNIKMSQIERWNKIKRSEILNVGDVIYLADPKKAHKR